MIIERIETMQEKIKIRSNLLNHNLKDIELSTNMSIRLEKLITQKSVCTYIPIESEINILPSLTSFLSLNTIFIEGDTLKICEYKAPFVKNHLGTFEPKFKNIKQNIELFIVPGVGFTKSGSRLGRGGGYYDKLLQKYPKAIKIGICHDFQVLKDLPIENNDVSMDYVLTNKNYYKSST